MSSAPPGEECWWCDRRDVPLVWVGDARSADQAFAAPGYACDLCRARLEARVQAYADTRYGAAPPGDGPRH